MLNIYTRWQGKVYWILYDHVVYIRAKKNWICVSELNVKF